MLKWMTQMTQIPNDPKDPNDSIDSNDSNDSMTGWQNAERYIWHYRLFLLDSEWSICPQFVWINIGTLAPYYRHLLIIIITPHLGKLKIGSWGGRSDYTLALELAPTIREVFTITEKAPTGTISLLKAPISAFTFKNLLRHYVKQVAKCGKCFPSAFIATKNT